MAVRNFINTQTGNSNVRQKNRQTVKNPAEVRQFGKQHELCQIIIKKNKFKTPEDQNKNITLSTFMHIYTEHSFTDCE